MKVCSDAIRDGFIEDRFGGRGTEFIRDGRISCRSVPVRITEYPPETVCFALIMDDPDAMKPAGVVWDHWLVCDLEKDVLPENAAREDPSLVMGRTTWLGRVIDTPEESAVYGGPNPPDDIHRYFIRVYALDRRLGLTRGFSRKELEDAMEGHVLASAETMGRYYPRTWKKD